MWLLRPPESLLCDALRWEIQFQDHMGSNKVIKAKNSDNGDKEMGNHQKYHQDPMLGKQPDPILVE